jgi:Glycine transporter
MAARKIPMGARSSAGEHYLDMVGVTGSIPVAPTTPSSAGDVARGRPTGQVPTERAAVTRDTKTANQLVLAADPAGVCVFAIEGPVAAMRGRLDLLGILVLAFATALGGGVIRDVLIGAVPSCWPSPPAR